VFRLHRNSEEAGNCYRRILELEPDNDDARLSLAALLIQGQNPQEALVHFEHLRARQGDTREVLRGLASCRHALNQPEEACRLLDALLAEHPRDGGALTDRGRLALQLESAAAAEKWCRQAVAVTPYEREAVYRLYQCLLRLGKRQEAEEVLARLKRIEEDLTRLNQTTSAVAKEPHNPALRCEVGRLLIRNGQGLEGLRWLESALRIDPHNPDTHQALADYYAGVADPERAARHRGLAQQLSARRRLAPGWGGR
jgi:predicted Zn-dependent protease